MTWASETQGFCEERRAQADARADKQSAIAVGNVDFDGITPARDVKTVLAGRFDDAGKSSEDYQSEAHSDAKYILKERPDAKIAVLYQNDDYGKDYVKGLKGGLGAKAASMIIGEESYECTEPSIDNHVVKLKATGADVFVDITAPKFAAQAIKKVSEIDWKPLHILNYGAAAGQCKQAAESNAVKLQESLQGQQERTEQLQQDLSRRDVEAQTALATKANDEASQLKQVAEVGSAELKRSLQRERDRAEALAQHLSTARAEIYAYEAQARTASDQAADRKQASESGAAELHKSLQQERERAEGLERDLAAARHNVETQAALAAKEAAEAARLKQDSDERSAELLRSLQQERDRTSQLERELASERKTKDASGVATVGHMQDKQVGPDTTKPVAADQATLAKATREIFVNANASIATAMPSPSATPQADAAQLTANDLQLKDPARMSAISAPAAAPVAAAPARRIDGGELATLMKRAKDLLAMDDIRSARLLLERAAEAQDASAALILARTYDAEVIGTADVRDITPDPAKARAWYKRAAEFGSAEAERRLAHMPN